MTRILWFHPRPWGPARGGGDLRTHGLVGCAIRAGHDVLLATPDAGTIVRPSGVEVVELPSPAGHVLSMAKVLSRHPLRSPRATRRGLHQARWQIGEFAPQMVVVSEVMAWSLAERLVPLGVPLVYDAANVESRLFRQLADRAAGLDRFTFAIDARRVARDEAVLLDRAASVLAVSEHDRDELRRLSSCGDVHVVPSSVPSPATLWSVDRSAASVLFVGTLDYPPNVDAVGELVREVMPRVRRQVDVRLIVAGRRPTRAVADLLAGQPWAELHQDVPDLLSLYLSSRCAVLPLRSGGGTKLKAYEALAYGIPLVATPAALQGIPLRDGEAIVGERPSDLADAVLELMSSDDAAANVGAAGRHAFEERLSWERASQPVLDTVLRGIG